MDEHGGRALAQIIDSIGTPRFMAATSQAIRALSGFERCSVVLHRAGAAPRLLFEDLAEVGCRAGIENYLRFTHGSNPMLARRRMAHGIVRARDFRIGRGDLRADLGTYLIDAPEEELGFRTIGWPPRMEELSLHFGAGGGTVEFSLYRARSRRSAPARTLQKLDAMRQPLAAAFERQAALTGADAPADPAIFARLTAREAEVARLLLTGCSSEAVALRLGITRYTVKDHRKEIFRKLRIGSLAELFALALEEKRAAS